MKIDLILVFVVVLLFFIVKIDHLPRPLLHGSQQLSLRWAKERYALVCIVASFHFNPFSILINVFANNFSFLGRKGTECEGRAGRRPWRRPVAR